jgi:hypothetical protein
VTDQFGSTWQVVVRVRPESLDGRVTHAKSDITTISGDCMSIGNRVTNVRVEASPFSSAGK